VILWCASKSHGDAIRIPAGQRLKPHVATPDELEAPRIRLHRRDFDRDALQLRRAGPEVPETQNGARTRIGVQGNRLAEARAGDSIWSRPAADRYEEPPSRWFTDAYIRERGRFYPDDSQDRDVF
jgi:hypothetical protein